MSVISKKSLVTASELFETLSPTNTLFADAPPQRWVFRGQGDSTYDLLPSSLRGGKLSTLTGQPCDIYAQHIWAEQRIIGRFFTVADRSGLPLPEDSQEFRTNLSRYCGDLYRGEVLAGRAEWPPTEFLSLMGLAQHYGVPTCLLDWTYNPLAAMYFAAEDAYRIGLKDNSLKDIGYFSVWCYNTDAYQADRIVQALRGKPILPLEIVSMPYAANPNINAQQGLFTLFRLKGIDGEALVDRTPVDQIIDSHFSFTAKTSPPMIKLDLPKSEAKVLLKILAKAGITGATIYAGFPGVAKAVTEHFWYSSQ